MYFTSIKFYIRLSKNVIRLHLLPTRTHQTDLQALLSFPEFYELFRISAFSE